MNQNTLIDLLRHGQPRGGRRYRGQQDDPLSARGWQQMWHAVSGETPWNRIISSPLLRCREFAQQLAERLSLPLTIEPRFEELGYGLWEGRTADELKQEDPEILKRFFYDPRNNTPPDAEPVDAFTTRISTAYSTVTTDHKGEHILIVAHACVIRAVISTVLNAPVESLFRMNVEEARFSRIRENNERPPTLLFHGRGRL